MAVDSQRRGPFVNPCLLHLQKMELELKCPACLKLFSNPVLLPCNHICCSPCIANTNDCSVSCPACASPFLSQDVRAVEHIKMLVSIFKSMNNTFAAHFLQPDCQSTMPEKIKGEPAQGIKNPAVPLGRTPKNDCFAEEAYSPPSFGYVKESDDDINDCRNGQLFVASCKRKLGDAATVQESLQENISLNKRINHGYILDCMNSEIHVKDFKNLLESQIQSGISDIDISGNNDNQSNIPNRDCLVSSKPEKDEMKAPISCNGPARSSGVCVFCHSFAESVASGPMLHYDNGNPVGKDHAYIPKSTASHV